MDITVRQRWGQETIPLKNGVLTVLLDNGEILSPGWHKRPGDRGIYDWYPLWMELV